MALLSYEMMQIHRDLDRDMKRIARRFKPGAKLTLVVRNPMLADGDVVLTDDDPLAAIEAIHRLEAERAAKTQGGEE